MIDDQLLIDPQQWLGHPAHLPDPRSPAIWHSSFARCHKCCEFMSWENMPTDVMAS